MSYPHMWITIWINGQNSKLNIINGIIKKMSIERRIVVMSTKIYNTPRLSAIIDKISADVIADIGTDHAYIPIHAVLEKRCSRALASDIRSGPLEIAKKNTEKYGVSDKISLRLGAGLDKIGVGEAEQIIIAGMGGMTITDILRNDTEKAKSAQSLLLQPMNDAHRLRKWLFENGFTIKKEDIAVEGSKVSNIFVCEKGEESAEEPELHIPSKLFSNENFGIFLDKKIREFSKIVTGIERASVKSDAEEEDLIRYKALLEYALKIK